MKIYNRLKCTAMLSLLGFFFSPAVCKRSTNWLTSIERSVRASRRKIITLKKSGPKVNIIGDDAAIHLICSCELNRMLK